MEGEMTKPTIDEILTAFEALTTGVGCDLDDPLQAQLLRVMNAAGRTGLTSSELVEAVLGRQLTREEDDMVVLKTEDAEGCA